MELLQRFVRGDLEAFEVLFRQHQEEVYRWIIRIVRDRGAAEDVTIETFWRIWRAHARFDPERSFGAWTRRIATHAALDHLKKSRPSEPLSPAVAAPAAPDSALAREQRERLARAFGELPARLKVVAVLALVEERPYAEISEAVGISEGGVKSRVFRAVRILRGKLARDKP